MVRRILVFLPILLLLAHDLINADDDGVDCRGQIQDGKLKIGRKWIGSIPVDEPNLSENCTTLEVHIANDIEIDWDRIERVEFPELWSYSIYLHTDDSNYVGQMKWKNLSLFGDNPHEYTRLALNFSVYVKNELVLTFDGSNLDLTIRVIDPIPFLSEFNPGDKMAYNEFAVRILILDNLDFSTRNLSSFIQKFPTVEELNLGFNNLEKINILDMLSPENLRELIIRNATLTCAEILSKKEEGIRSMKLLDVVLDPYFKENAWKAMPYLGTLEIGLKHEQIDLYDIAAYKQVDELSINAGNITLSKKSDQAANTKRMTLDLKNCIFDAATFVDDLRSVFPNLVSLSIEAGQVGTKTTPELLAEFLAKFPEAQTNWSNFDKQ